MKEAKGAKELLRPKAKAVSTLPGLSESEYIREDL